LDRAAVGWKKWLAAAADRPQGCECVVRELYDIEVERVLAAEKAGIVRSTSDAVAANDGMWGIRHKATSIHRAESCAIRR